MTRPRATKVAYAKALTSLVKRSTDNKCAFCLTESDDLEVAHIVSKTKKYGGGPYSFWNLLPACSNCNPSARERQQPRALQSAAASEKSYYYWLFKKQRTDVGLKVALNYVFETAALTKHLTSEHLTKARRFICYVLGESRAFAYHHCIEECLKIEEILVPEHERSSLAQLHHLEHVVSAFDFGRFTWAGKALLDMAGTPMVLRRGPSFTWRLAQDPRVRASRNARKLLDALRKNWHQRNVPGEASEFYTEERKYDSSLRELGSELAAALADHNETAIRTGINDILSEYKCEPRGAGHVHQRLHVILQAARGAVKLDSKMNAKLEELIGYTRAIGSQSPIRSLFMPITPYFGMALERAHFLSSSFPITSGSHDLGQLFRPNEQSYAHVFESQKRLIREMDLLAVLKIIFQALKDRKDLRRIRELPIY